MIEKDTIAAIHVVAFAIVLHNPKSIELGHGIGRTGIKRCGFALRHFHNFSKQFGSGRLIYLAFVGKSADSHGFEQTEHTYCVGVGSIFGHVKRNLDMALRCKVVDFRRLHLGYHTDKRRRIGHVCPMKVNQSFLLHVAHPFIKIQMFYALRVERRRTAQEAVHLISFTDKKLCKIRTVLSCDACD